MKIHSILSLIALISIIGCKPFATAPDSGLNAIVSEGGNQAAGLMFMRRRIESELQNLNLSPSSDEYRSVKTEASRLVLGLVQCEGSGAVAAYNSIEAKVLPRDKNDNALRMLDAVKFENGRIKGRNGETINDACSVSSQSLGGAALARILAKDPETQPDFENIQLIYLAARGPYKGREIVGFQTGLYQFLNEAFGAIAPDDILVQNDRIAKLDAMFNPCDPLESEIFRSRNLSKHRLFKKQCDAFGNYVVDEKSKSDELIDGADRTLTKFEQAERNLAALVARENEVYYRSLIAVNRIGALALSLSTDGKSSLQQYVEEYRNEAKNRQSPPPGNPNDIELNPTIKALGNDVKAIELMFGVKIGQAPGQVLSEFAYVEAPAALVARAASSSGLSLADPAAGWSGWTKQADGNWTGSLYNPQTQKTEWYDAKGNGADNWIVKAYDGQGGKSLSSRDYMGYYDSSAKGYYLSSVNDPTSEWFQRSGAVAGQANSYQNYRVDEQAPGYEIYRPQGNVWQLQPNGQWAIGSTQGSEGYLAPNGIIWDDGYNGQSRQQQVPRQQLPQQQVPRQQLPQQQVPRQQVPQQQVPRQQAPQNDGHNHSHG